MPQIPIDNLHVRRYSETAIGCIYAHETTIPVVVVTAKDGTVTVKKNDDPLATLGEWLPGIGERLSKAQVESLVKGREVKL